MAPLKLLACCIAGVVEEVKAQVTLAATLALDKMRVLIKHDSVTDAFKVLQLPFWIDHKDDDQDELMTQVKVKVEVLRMHYGRPAYLASGEEVAPLVSSSGLDQEFAFFTGRYRRWFLPFRSSIA